MSSYLCPSIFMSSLDCSKLKAVAGDKCNRKTEKLKT